MLQLSLHLHSSPLNSLASADETCYLLQPFVGLLFCLDGFTACFLSGLFDSHSCNSRFWSSVSWQYSSWYGTVGVPPVFPKLTLVATEIQAASGTSTNEILAAFLLDPVAAFLLVTGLYGRI